MSRKLSTRHADLMSETREAIVETCRGYSVETRTTKNDWPYFVVSGPQGRASVMVYKRSKRVGARGPRWQVFYPFASDEQTSTRFQTARDAAEHVAEVLGVQTE